MGAEGMTSFLHPKDLPDTVMKLANWWGTPDGIDFGRDFVASMDESGDGGYQMSNGGGFRDFGDLIASMAQASFQEADLFWVAPEMVELVKSAEATMPDQKVLLDDIPTKANGFAYFAEPLMFMDKRGRSTNFRAVTWLPIVSQRQPEHLALMVLWYSDHVWGIGRGEFEDENSELLYETTGSNLNLLRRIFGGDLSLIHSDIWPLDASLPHLDVDTEIPPHRPASNRGLRRHLAAFWLLSQQRIAAKETAYAPRPTRKRAAKAGVPSEVSVITLRRPRSDVPEAEDGTDKPEHEWTIQWMVSGHWRQQWYPSTQSHRPVWITPYLKGPEDKPLVMKKKVYQWVR